MSTQWICARLQLQHRAVAQWAERCVEDTVRRAVSADVLHDESQPLERATYRELVRGGVVAAVRLMEVVA